MGRHPPPGLPDAQRDALSEFFHGHLSAGQLTERLRDGQPPPETSTAAASEPATAEMPGVPGRRRGFSIGRGVRGVLVVGIVAAGGVAAGIAVGSHPQPVAAQTHRGHIAVRRSHHRKPRLTSTQAGGAPLTSTISSQPTTAPAATNAHAATQSRRRTRTKASGSATTSTSQTATTPPTTTSTGTTSATTTSTSNTTATTPPTTSQTTTGSG